MRKPKRSAATIRAEMEELREQMKAAEAAEEAEIGRMARQAGVFDLGLQKAELRQALNDMVARFREPATPAPAQVNGSSENPQ